jgi:regulator of ribonuclease activity A
VSGIVLPDLCDAYPDMVRVVEPVFSSFGGRTAFGGRIVTVKCFEDNSLVANALEEAGHGCVLVVDAGGSLRCGIVGDRLAGAAARNGWEGVVIHGCVRDVDALAAIDVGIQALAPHPMKSIKRGVGERDLVVHFGSVSFVPGQYVYADNNGILVSPTALPLPA